MAHQGLTKLAEHFSFDPLELRAPRSEEALSSMVSLVVTFDFKWIQDDQGPQ